MPKVSVIVPVYGVEKYIERCARSLFEQTLDDIEFIFVDDCTPDRSIEILNAIIEEYRLRFAEMNYTVRIERMPTNSGQAAVRRHGIQLATGEYILHCDSDDWIDHTTLEKLYCKAISEHADLVLYDNFTSDGENNFEKFHYLSTNKLDYFHNFLVNKASCAVWSKFAKRQLYSSVKTYPKGAMGEDLAISSQLIIGSIKIAVLNERLYYYYINSSSITRAPGKEKILRNFSQVIDNVNITVKSFQDAGLYDKYYKDFVVLKHIKRCMLMSLTSQKQYRDLLLHTFPEINRHILFSPYISFRDKMQFIKLVFDK